MSDGLTSYVATTLGMVGSGDGIGHKDLNNCFLLFWAGSVMKNILSHILHNFFFGYGKPSTYWCLLSGDINIFPFSFYHAL